MNTRFLTLLITLTFLGFSVSALAKGKPSKPPKPPVEAAVVYTAELTGAFVFNVEVTPNSKGNELRSSADLNMTPRAAVAATWDFVFNACTELVVPDSVDSFFVGEDDWSIEKPGGVRVIFRDIILGDAEVTVQLIGNEFDFVVPFIPESGLISGSTSTRYFSLDQAAIYGSTLKGIHPRKSCQPPGGGSFDIFDLGYFDGANFVATPSTLVITATRQ